MTSKYFLSLCILGVAGQLAYPVLAQDNLPRLMPDDLFRRNIGTEGQLDAQFPPHRIIDNIYYVGTESLASFLITTDAGHILVNSCFERNVPTIRDSVEQLGFDFDDIEIIMINAMSIVFIFININLVFQGAKIDKQFENLKMIQFENGVGKKISLQKHTSSPTP